MPGPAASAVSVVCRDGTVLAEREAKATDGVIVVDALPIRRQSVDLYTRLARALEPLERIARGSEVGFTLVRSPDLPAKVVLDAEKVVWAIATLVGNSLRYVRRGNRVLPGGSVTVSMAVDTKANEVKIDVEDDGPGMPESAAVVLRGGSSADANAPALALVSDVVKAQGGRIDVKSSQDAFDHGTKVTIHLPLDA